MYISSHSVSHRPMTHWMTGNVHQNRTMTHWMTGNVHQNRTMTHWMTENVQKSSTTTITLASSNSGLYDVSLITE
jgi:hypothetical protein